MIAGIRAITDVPEDLRLEAIQLGMLLLPDEHREVLQTLLSFLNDVASFSDSNQVVHFFLHTPFSHRPQIRTYIHIVAA